MSWISHSVTGGTSSIVDRIAWEEPAVTRDFSFCRGWCVAPTVPADACRPVPAWASVSPGPATAAGVETPVANEAPLLRTVWRWRGVDRMASIDDVALVPCQPLSWNLGGFGSISEQAKWAATPPDFLWARGDLRRNAAELRRSGHYLRQFYWSAAPQ